MRRLLLLYVILAVPLLAMIGAAMALGDANDVPPRSPVTLAATCLLPCWRGIEPGEIFIAHANRILIGQGYTARQVLQDRRHIHYFPSDQHCTVRLEHTDAVVTETRLFSCPTLYVGDIIAALGEPHSLSPNFLFYHFDDGVIRVRLQADTCDESLSPRTLVTYISLKAEPHPLLGQIQWQGFAPNWRYFQTAPHVPPLAC